MKKITHRGLNGCGLPKFYKIFRKNSAHSIQGNKAQSRDNGRINVNDFYVAGIPDDR